MTIRRTLFTPSAALLIAAAVSTAAGAQDRERPRPVAPDAAGRVVTRAYQGGRNNGPEQTERVSRKVKISRDGRLYVENISGDVVVTGGSGDEVSIEAVKKTRGDRSQLANVEVNVEERAGRVDVSTSPTMRNSRAWVDYTITVPASVAVEVHSISGDIRISNVQGNVRGESVSGDVTMTGTPNLETAKTVSGDVSLSGVSTTGDLSAGSGSGNLTANGLKVRGLELSSISGDMVLSNIICDRLATRTISGNIDFGGRILKGGRYEYNSHSGDVRLRLQNPGGFELNASSFSGSIRSDISLVIHSEPDSRGRDRRGAGSGRGGSSEMNHSMQATYGDGSATLIVRTFSGDVVLTER